MVARLVWLLAAVVALSACPAAEPERTLDDRQLLIRASLDLRGVRPAEAEYARLEADPEALPALLEEYLADERFGARMRELYTPIVRTRIDQFPVDAQDYGLTDDAAFQASVGDEVPRIIGRIADEDLPFTEVVVGDWTMANEILGQVWPVEHAGTGWQVSRYTDARPKAGILATNSLWWRYPSNGVNYNRGRANALSRILLCNDYLSREVAFPRDIDLTDQALVDDALRTNPGCVNCHVSLDAMASYLFGFQYPANAEADDASRYHPERERDWTDATGVEPAYYGEPGFTLEDLGHQIAGDNRFVECAVETVFQGLVARDAALADRDELTRHREAFLTGGLTLRALVRSILTDDAWLGQAGVERNAAVRKIVTPDLLASQIEALTGYRFTVDGRDMMKTDLFGLRSLGGGVDGYSGAAPSRVPTPTMVLVQERLAQAAAWHAATRESAMAPRDRTLFRGIDFTETPQTGEAAMVEQIRMLHRTIFGTVTAPDAPQVTEALALWSDLYAIEHTQVDAWAGVLSVLLRDPDLIFY